MAVGLLVILLIGLVAMVGLFAVGILTNRSRAGRNGGER